MNPRYVLLQSTFLCSPQGLDMPSLIDVALPHAFAFRQHTKIVGGSHTAFALQIDIGALQQFV